MPARETEVAIARASLGLGRLGSRDGSAPIGGPAPAAHSLGQGTAHVENPLTRVQEQLALWTSPRMKEILATLTEAALIDVTVLIAGETGTGKELVARAVHYLGGRRNGPFVKVNCAPVARALPESELFGHGRGAFTGAYPVEIGKFATANRGTIFFDEIADLPPALQAELLHALEDGQVSRVGGRSTVNVDVRVVAATNQDLEAAVSAGAFREDLFYRLNVIRIAVPPLRERVEEIPALANYFVERYTRFFRQESLTLPLETMRWLKQQSFRGNVRELENMIKGMVVLRDPDVTRVPIAGVTSKRGEPLLVKKASAVAGSLRAISRKAARAAEQSAIVEALEETRWNGRRAAKLLNISYRSLLYKIKEAGPDGKRKAPEFS